MANHVKNRRKLLKLTQQQVADAASTTKATVMKLEKGDMQLTENWITRLAIPLKCRPEDLISDQGPMEVPLVGEVGASGAVKLFIEIAAMTALQEPTREVMERLEKAPTPPETGYRNIQAMRIKTDAMMPFLPAESLIYYADAVNENFDHYRNKQVIAATQDGKLRLCQLQNGDDFGTYHLHCSLGEVLKNQSLIWCARVIFMKPA